MSLQINPIHSSGSANSLQHLADTACIYCGDGAEEKAERLVEVKPPCKCSFSLHASCWEAQENHTCPSCKKSIIPTHILPRPEQLKQVGMTHKTALWIALIVALCIAFAIGLGISMKSH